MPNATVRANARPMPEAKPDEYWRHAYFDLEEKIRDRQIYVFDFRGVRL